MHQKLSTGFEVLERFLRLIRPRFYNRLTWVVVVAGLLLTASPWWGDLVNALAQKLFGVSVPVTKENAVLGFGLVAIGLAYHIAAHSIYELVAFRREAAELGARGEHDRRIFLQLTSAAPEQQFLGILQSIATLHQYRSSEATLIYRTVAYLRAPSNQFLTDDIAVAANQLALTLEELQNFISLNFFEHISPPKGDMRFCLFPAGNDERSSGIPSPEEAKRYGELSVQLEGYVSEAEAGYANFRSALKRRLAV
jgi:hypothetical protein